MSPGGRQYRGALAYRTDLFDARPARRLAGWYLALLAGLVAGPDAPVGGLPLEPADGPVRTWAADAYGSDRPLHELIATGMRADPGGDRRGRRRRPLTYARAGPAANRVAPVACSRPGYGREEPVGVLTERGHRRCPSRCSAC